MTAHPIPDAALESHLAVLGTSGYGKTNAIKGAVERLMDRGERVVIVDPTGVWWGLRLTRGGKQPSPYPLVIFGGRHADLPLEAGAGERIGQVLGASTTPAILDTQQMSVAGRTHFFTDFAEAILRENRRPLHLVIDEAHLFAPQSGGAGLVPALLHATNNLVALGRSAGLRIVLITQRAAKLHKDALSQATGLVVMGLVDPRDQKAAKGWLDGAPDQSRAREIMASLSSLPVGTGWIYAPRIGVLEKAAFPLVETFDSGRPEANADASALEPLDVEALREAMSLSSSTDEAKRDTVTSVSRSKWPKNGSAVKRQARAEEIAEAERRGKVRGIELGVAAGWKAAATLFERDITVLAQVFPCDAQGHEEGMKEVEAALLTLQGPTTPPPSPAPAQKSITPAMPRGRPAIAAAGLNSAARKMLKVLDTNPPVRRSWQQVATLVGLKARGGHFNAGKKSLVHAGLIAEHGHLVAIATPSAGAGPAAIDPGQLVETWCKVLTGAAPKILRKLFQSKGGLRRPYLADLLNMQPRGGHWNAAWKELRDNGLVTIDRDDVARLSELFRKTENC